MDQEREAEERDARFSYAQLRRSIFKVDSSLFDVVQRYQVRYIVPSHLPLGDAASRHPRGWL